MTKEMNVGRHFMFKTNRRIKSCTYSVTAKIRNMLVRQCMQTYGACKIVMLKKRLNS